MTIAELYACYRQHPIVCTDTRNIQAGCMFFALKGEKFNANTFAQQALDLGAAYAIVDETAYANNKSCILVPDVLTCLQDLARYHRQHLKIPVIGLTGSNGKTTTKELIKAVLSEKFRVSATRGNLNNHIGVPLTLLSIGDEIELAIVEMGANHQQEIAFLCDIAQPTHGLISNVGMAHLEGFGGFEGVKKGKAELYTYLAAHKGQVFVNAANTDLMEMLQKSGAKQVEYYNNKHRNMVSGQLLQQDPYLSVAWAYQGKHYEVSTQLTGSYNFENILAAISLGCHFGLTAKQINAGLAGYIPQNNRSQISQTEHNQVICDFYNANPSSMEAAIANLGRLSAKHKIAILGDMFELGQESAKMHQRVIDLAMQAHFAELIFIGTQFYQWHNDYKARFFEKKEDAQSFLQKQTWRDSLVLLKGSRGMALETLLPSL